MKVTREGRRLIREHQQRDIQNEVEKALASLTPKAMAKELLITFIIAAPLAVLCVWASVEFGAFIAMRLPLGLPL